MYRANNEPMQIISGPIGREHVHFEAPPSHLVPKVMQSFIYWFNNTSMLRFPGPIRAAIAHIYFESIHPFQDGNGRIGRAITEKALAQDLGTPSL